MMKRSEKSRYDPKGSIGVNAVEAVVLKEWSWRFERAGQDEIGVDARVEIHGESELNGKSIGLQIKCGPGNFELVKEGLVYYASNEHLDYWLSQSFPVLIVGHLPEAGRSYWQWVNRTTAQRTVKQWKILLPYSQELNREAKVPVMAGVKGFVQMDGFSADACPVQKQEDSWVLVDGAREGEWHLYIDRSFAGYGETNSAGRKVRLRDLLIQHHHLVILAGGGAGKSMALKRLSLDLSWDESPFVPIYRRFTDFVDGPLETMLPAEWENIPSDQLVLVLDGLDEALPEEYYAVVRRIRTYCADHPGIRVVLSCRSNFVEGHDGHAVGALDSWVAYSPVLLTRPEVAAYATKSGVDGKRFLRAAIEGGFGDLMTLPFYLRLLVNVFRKGGHLRGGRAALFQTFIDEGLIFNEEHFKTARELKRRRKEVTLVLQRIALVMEKLGRNWIADAELAEIMVGRDYELLKAAPLFCRRADKEASWAFEHQNFQEYLAASALKDKPWNEIRKVMFGGEEGFWLIPAWANTFGFLVELMKDPVRDECLTWLKTYDPKAIFRLEPARIGEPVRLEVLKMVFEDYRKKGLWLNSASFEPGDFGAFCSFGRAVDYLITELASDGNPMQSRLNALKLLGWVRLERRQKDRIKPVIVRMLEENNPSFSEVHQILYGIGDLMPEDEGLVDRMVEKYRDSINQHIRAAMYRLLINSGRVEKHWKFFAAGISISALGVEGERVSTSLSDEVTNLEAGFGTIEDPKLLATLIPVLGGLARSEPRHLYRISGILKLLVENCAYMVDADEGVYQAVCSLFVSFPSLGRDLSRVAFPVYFHERENNVRLMEEWLSTPEGTFTLDDSKLAALLDAKTAGILYSAYRAGRVNKREVVGAFGALGQYSERHPGKIAALEVWGELMRSVKDFQPEPLTAATGYLERDTYSTALLFDAEAFRGEILALFRGREGDISSVHDLFWLPRDPIPVEGMPESVWAFLRLFPPWEGIDRLQRVMENEAVFLDLRMRVLLGEINGRQNTAVSQYQVAMIRDWCMRVCREGSGRPDERHSVVWGFVRMFKLDLPVEYLLDFTVADLDDDGVETFGVLEKNVAQELLEGRVIRNLNTGIDSSSVWRNNVAYALRRGLAEVYPLILDELANPEKELADREKVLDGYFFETADADELQELLMRVGNDPLRWAVIAKLVAVERCRPHLLGVLSPVMVGKDVLKEDRMEAAKYLTALQDMDGISYYLAGLSGEVGTSVRMADRNLRVVTLIRRLEAIPVLLDFLAVVHARDLQGPERYLLEDIVMQALTGIAVQSPLQLDMVTTALMNYMEAHEQANYLWVRIDQMQNQYVVKEGHVGTVEEAIRMTEGICG